MKYKAEVTFEASSPEEASQKFLAALYAGDIDSATLTIAEVGTDNEVFRFPFTQKLIRHLNEGK